tara:strand:+ start:175 stop:309 length:135 start_codon:yes stop_codon:yes gene_type:complete
MEVIPCGAGWIVTKLKAIAERMLPPVITACRRRGLWTEDVAGEH